MFENIIIILVTSFIFDFIFGSFLIKRPELFKKIQEMLPKTKARFVYKFIFIMAVGIVVLGLKNYIDIDETLMSIILGISISISGVLFNTSKESIVTQNKS